MSGPIAELDTAEDTERRARAVLNSSVFDFIAGGAGAEHAVRANREEFERRALRPRILAGLDAVDTRTRLLGADLAAPLMVAPMGTHRLVHDDGEIASARAAHTCGVGYVASSAASVPLEETASPMSWFQLYVLRDRGITEDMVRRADASGYRALCLTVDVPVIGRRHRDLRNAFELPPDVRRVNLDPYVARDQNTTAIDDFPERAEPALAWNDLEWLRSLTELPIVIKGVMTAEDATIAAEHGVAAIYVSNHGGRQLDRTPGTIAVLEEVAAATELPIVLDGGVRSATDVIVALSLGATAVAVGRPVLWSLATGGEAGVARFMTELVEDIARTMHLIGRGSIQALDRSTVHALQHGTF